MTSDLLETLLHGSEGTDLDYKVAQYPFAGASDEDKSELLKDILAFANAWRRAEAYILIGVRPVPGGRHIIEGTEAHPDEAHFQQFVNSKTNRRVDFSYSVLLIEGKRVGVFCIPRQQRPVYAKRDFGDVIKELVYYRLGSSTAVATPDQVAQMGRDDGAEDLALPMLELQLADFHTRELKGASIHLHSTFCQVTESLPDLPGGHHLGAPPPNPGYWRQLAEYVRLKRFLCPVGFVVRNGAPSVARSVRLEISQDRPDGMEILDIGAMPSRPTHRLISPQQVHRASTPTTVVHHGSRWTLTIAFGDIQPKAWSWSQEATYIGSRSPKLDLDGLLFADNLPNPQPVHLLVTSYAMVQQLTMAELRAEDRKPTI